MTKSADEMLLLASQLSIELVDGACIYVSDGNGKKGGNVHARGASRFRWTNRTDLPCRLVFRELVIDGYGVLREIPIWPFEEQEADVGENGVNIPARDGSGEAPGRWSGTLRIPAARVVIKYDVVVSLDTGDELKLDPMIVVER